MEAKKKSNRPLWEKLSTTLLGSLESDMQNLSNEQLEALCSVDKKATKDKTWWVIYEGRDLISSLAYDILTKRERYDKPYVLLENTPAGY